jgi:hypothetical protein
MMLLLKMFELTLLSCFQEIAGQLNSRKGIKKDHGALPWPAMAQITNFLNKTATGLKHTRGR